MSFIYFIILSLSTSIYGDYITRPVSELVALGFKRKQIGSFFIRASSRNTKIFDDHSLDWPIQLERPKNQFIGNMHQYQTYSDPPYYHGGVDILANRDQLVVTPITGIIEAGYYSYTDEYDGTTEKYFLPLKEALEGKTEIPWGKAYFEVAIIDNRGHRLEFHHVDPDDLPQEILQKILEGNQIVEAGTVVGKVYDWGIKKGKIETRHIHYNIINSEGNYLNPFLFSKYVADETPPVITDIYATKKSFCYKAPELIKFEKEPLQTQDYIVVRTIDIFNKSVFSKAPVLIRARFQNGKEFTWDFTESIIDHTGRRPHIRDVYLVKKCIPSLRSELKASTSHDFYFKIPVDPYYSGDIEITVYDQNYNSATKTVTIIGESI